MATDTTRSTVSPFESWSKKNGGQVTVSNMPKTTPKKQKPERLAHEPDVEVSPSTHVSPVHGRSIAGLSWDTPEFGEYRRDLSCLDGGVNGGGVPSIAHQKAPDGTPPPPFGRHNRPSHLSSNIFNNSSFYSSSSDYDIPQMSPGFVPPNGNNLSLGWNGEDRRPSVASTMTVSSTGSKRSISNKFHKKLAGFFGDDFDPNAPPPPPKEVPEPPTLRGRNPSNATQATQATRTVSPAVSRPRTPNTSSEVTPWDFVPAPATFHTQTTPSGAAASQQQQLPSRSQKSSVSSASHRHRLHLPGHKHKSSLEDIDDGASMMSARPATIRKESTIALLGNNGARPRALSPSPSMASMNSSMQQTQQHDPSHDQRSPSGPQSSGKRSLFNRVTGRKKTDKAAEATLKSMPSSTNSLSQTPTAPTGKKRAPLGADGKPLSVGLVKKDHTRLPFKGAKRAEPSAEYNAKDPNAQRPDAIRNASALWHLDTDMTSMEGIINRTAPMTPPINATDIFTGFPNVSNTLNALTAPNVEAPKAAEEEAGTWEVPDSWAVKRVPDSNVAALREVDEDGQVPRDEDPGPMYFMRIFRADSTFAVISAGLNTTASELIQMMAKKTFLQDELDTYQIVMRKTGSSRILAGGERPLAIQKAMLEMAGYNEKDKPEDLGREDHGYLVRFTFLPGKLGGYSSLDRDPGFNKTTKFNHIDLAGRDLVAIPIALYPKAAEIITLNLSKNLSLDIPKDFIQSCTNLREIKYTSNEAWKLPASICLASRLTMLDVSNNRLEQMQHADLHKLHNLVSLKLSNNKLTTLPAYFGCYQALRSLNLASNNLNNFPDYLCELRTVVDLDISFNSIEALPKVGKLVNLERLFATNNKLSGAFPDSFKQLVKLTQIDIRFNSLDNIDVMAQLPLLEHLLVGHNCIAAYELSFYRIKVLSLDHNPVTRFGLTSPVPTLSLLNLASAKLTQLPDDLFAKISNITKLVLDKNHFTAISPLIGRLTKLEHLSLAKNMLNNLPPDIGRLQNMKYLDIRENNLSRLPQEIWYARKLESLNISSNVLNEFPKPGAPPASLPSEVNTPVHTPGAVHPHPSHEFDELGRLEAFQLRRPSQVGHGLLTGGSPSGRKASIASTYGGQTRNPSLAPRASLESGLSTATGSGSRKDSTMSNRLALTFSTTLRHLILADNRLSDDIFDEIVLLPELRVLNLSYNELYDIPPRTIRRWPHLAELYLSGNDLSALPAEDFEDGSGLRVLHLNSNRFNVLPAELGKIQKLQTLDVGSNALKYNVSNWPYDWNWNWNHQLRYLNMSGNKRLEIKPNANVVPGRETRDLTDFSTLQHLRILGLMDVTLTIPSVPDQGPDRRVRTAGSTIGTHIPYGMADTLGRHEHLSTLDMVIPSFGGHEDRLLFGMFDGQSLTTSGSKVAKFLYEKFRHHFADELAKIQDGDETPLDALRRAYLSLNKDLATAATQALEARAHPSSAILHRGSITILDLEEEDMISGAVATIMYLQGMELYVSNVGDAQAVLIDSEGGHRVITRKHAPAEEDERIRIREAGGYVSRQGKLNDVLEVSRAFGYVQHLPGVIACPHTAQISLKESDEIIVIASRELWDYLTMDFAVDVARSERGDLMRAAQKLRDLAIAFGATGKIMVMVIGVSDLRKRERARFRTHSMSMGPSGAPDELLTTSRRPKRGRDNVGDSKLARLDQEIDPPQGELTLVFTDIKNSTMLWETYPIAMRSAIKLHNELMRRHLRIIGGYEVKTEGDAFMVAFQTVTSALLWTFTMQSQLLDVPWPQEIINSVHGQEVLDADGNRIFRGLSVRMGIHFGQPVCEQDPVTGRMDYFGPMVNRSARIQSVADGGQITVSSDFIAEIQRLLETHIEIDRTNSAGSEDAMGDEMISSAIRRELRSLSSQGFEVKDLGQRNLKGLENPEYIYLMYPHSLAARLVVQQQQQAQAEQAKAAAAAAPTDANVGIESASGDMAKKSADSQLSIDTSHVWDLWSVSLRLEMLCSSLETTGLTALKAPETALLERMKQRGGEITDRFVINFVEHQVSRIETCVTTLALRHMVQPFGPGILATSKPISEILSEITAAMQDYQRIKEL